MSSLDRVFNRVAPRNRQASSGRTVSLRRDPASELGAYMVISEDGRPMLEVGTEVSFELVVKLLQDYRWQTVLDVGCGNQEHARIFRAMGKTVTTLDPVFAADLKGDFLETKLPEQYDVVFCSHVLEHQRNIGVFVDKLFEAITDDGYLAISVPPEMVHWVCFGHPNQLNAGFLIYHLIMGGFDCREAVVLTYGYNVSVIVPKKPNGLPKGSWALEKDDVVPFFPSGFVSNSHQVNGAVRSIGWSPVLDIPPHFNAGI